MARYCRLWLVNADALGGNELPATMIRLAVLRIKQIEAAKVQVATRGSSVYSYLCQTAWREEQTKKMKLRVAFLHNCTVLVSSLSVSYSVLASTSPACGGPALLRQSERSRDDIDSKCYDRATAGSLVFLANGNVFFWRTGMQQLCFPFALLTLSRV